jgi:hypothetical protein
MSEAKPFICARQDRSDTLVKDWQLREARHHRYASKGRSDARDKARQIALGKSSQLRRHGRAVASGKAWQMREARQGR